MIVSYDTEFIIDENIRKLIPLTSNDDLILLKKSIKNNKGCIDPIIVWKDKNIIIDGLERYKICKKSKYDLNVNYLDFKNIKDVEYYILKLMIKSNFKNRGFETYSLYARYEFVMKYNERIINDIENNEEWCKEIKIDKNKNIIQKNLARVLNTSATCLRKVQLAYNEYKDNKEIKEKMRSGEISPNKIDNIIHSNNKDKENNNNDNNITNDNNKKIIDVNKGIKCNSANINFIIDEIDSIYNSLIIRIENTLKLLNENDIKDDINRMEYKHKLLKMTLDINDGLKKIINESFDKKEKKQ